MKYLVNKPQPFLDLQRKKRRVKKVVSLPEGLPDDPDPRIRRAARVGRRTVP
jgi:hypothetical protein